MQALAGRLQFLALLLLAASVRGQEIFFFGDSLSDDGQGYAGNVALVLQTNQTYPQDPYYMGRWSNGPVWIEIVANQMGVVLRDYAAAGATSGTAPARLTLPTTVLSFNIFQQVREALLDESNSLNADALYFIEFGGNDAFSTVFAKTTIAASQITNNIVSAVSQLYAHGARKFVLIGPPALSGLPVFTQPEVYGNYSSDLVANSAVLTGNVDTQLQDVVNNIPNTFPGASATYFDFGASLGALAMNAQSYGLTNLMQACYVIAPNLTDNPTPTSQPIGAAGGTVCNDQDAHLFWDQFHPSRVAHEFIGAYFVQQLGSKLFPGKAQTPAPGSSTLPTLPYVSITGK